MTRYGLAGRTLEYGGTCPEPGWAAVAGAPGEPDLRVQAGPGPELPEGARRVLSSPAGEAWEADGARYLRVGERRAVVRAGEAWADDLAHPLGEMVATSLLEGRALELHAGAVVRDGEAWALAGVSGAGKSTLTGLWGSLPGWRRLAEERLLAWPDAEGWLVEAAPWPPGVERSGGIARLAGILLLARAPRPELSAVSPGEAVASLLRATFFLSGSPRSLQAVGRLSADLVRRLPVLRLATPATVEAMAEVAGRLSGRGGAAGGGIPAP